jgi:autotransporter family porin
MAPAQGLHRLQYAAMLAATLTAAALLGLPAVGRAHSAYVSARIGQPPLSDSQAARRVRGAWEPRPNNWADNHRVPSRAQLRAFHGQNTQPYSHWVDGQYRGTTDQIIQWAAAKWGLSTDLLRAVAATETWWNMSFVGNDGDAFGLFQVRRPYHCQGPVCNLFRHDTAFNADYYGSIIRSYYDGKQTWLNTVSDNGAPYRAGDLWGSVGYWCSGRWHAPAVWLSYVNQTKRYLAVRAWAQPNFVGR